MTDGEGVVFNLKVQDRISDATNKVITYVRYIWDYRTGQPQPPAIFKMLQRLFN